MTKLVKKLVVALAIASVSAMSLVGCGSSSSSSGVGEALIMGVAQFNGVFSPFYYTSSYDKDVWEQVHALLIENNSAAEPTPGLADFNIEEVAGADGKVEKTVYTFTLKEGVKFSDGTPITADDIIFNLKVYCDPTYTGMATINSLPIVGLKEYRYDDVNYSAKIEEIKAESQNITDEDIKAHIKSYVTEDVAASDQQAVMDYVGFTNPDGLEGAALEEALVNAYYEYEVANYFEDYRQGTIDAKYSELEQAYINENLSGGDINVTDIEGIQKIDDRTVQITLEGIDPSAIWKFQFAVAPQSYYGVADDGTEFKKGDLSIVESRNANPVGAGPYVFEKYENNVVTLRANENYYKGVVKIPTLKIQVTSESNKINSVATGAMDVTDPSASIEAVEEVKAANLHYELVDNLGYGYIGISASRIPDINVRKGLMSLMNREPAIETYYGELATVLERPMSSVSWAYPEGAEAVYTFSPQKALEYFKAAGYEQVNGVLQKDGEQLRIEVGIAGDGTMNHPAAPILTQMKAEFEKLGGVLEINDCDGSILFDRMNAHAWDMWVAAWGSDIDPDMYQVYHSEGASNHYDLKDSELDKEIEAARQTNDIEVRKEHYAKALDIVMDEAVIMPVYQRKNMYIYNPEVVDITTLPEDMSPYYGFPSEIINDISNVQLVK